MLNLSCRRMWRSYWNKIPKESLFNTGLFLVLTQEIDERKSRRFIIVLVSRSQSSLQEQYCRSITTINFEQKDIFFQMLLCFSVNILRVSSYPLCPSGTPLRNGDPRSHSITSFRKSLLFFPLFLFQIKSKQSRIKEELFRIFFLPFMDFHDYPDQLSNLKTNLKCDNGTPNLGYKRKIALLSFS